MKIYNYLLLLAILGPASALVVERSAGSTNCRCRPTDPCWPTSDQWNALNSSIGGNLVAVRPVAAACHDPDFDQQQCDAALANNSDSLWRSEQPGAVQWTNWEAWPERNESCYPELSHSPVCKQGRIPLYSALVENAQHIQEAVRFASQHNVRLAIKNSGHCFLGRSIAPDSLQVSTYKMDNIQFVDDFYATGASGASNASLGSAVTMGAGVKLKPLYAAAAERNLSFAVGLAHTVGAAGGYIQGGGHSPLGHAKGMASDNVLEFKVVKANGDLVVANEHQNRDLFWALRGGGGGTFGVVVSVAIRTFPDMPTLYAGGQVDIPGTVDERFWNTVTALHKSFPSLSDAGASGYYSVLPYGTASGTANGTAIPRVSFMFFFVNKTDIEPAKKVLDAFINKARKYTQAANYTIDALPSVIHAIYEGLKTTDSDGTGAIVAIASRLISRDFLSGSEGPGRLSNAFKEIFESDNSTGWTGHLVAGGAVARNKDIDSALNPAWRRAITHITFGRSWPDNTTFAEQRAIRHKLTYVDNEKLRALEPDMGAYLNEADAYEKDFQQSFWGDNYKRLYKIKQRVDPKGLFIVRSGVGSEDWDDDGLCRITKACGQVASQVSL